ncbi:MAG: hypothetical protein ABI321_06965 [Polyangia bacterium]
MRCASLCLVVLASARVLASPSIHLAPFTNHCFDHARLAERLRQHGLTIDIGPATTRAGQHVEVRGSDSLEVRIEARDDESRVVGLETRRIPDGPCDGVLETTEFVVVRAATPLHFIPDEPKPRPRVPRHVEPATPVVVGPPVPELLNNAPAVEPAEGPKHEPPVVRVIVITAPPTQPPVPPRRPLRIELTLHGLWLFPLDGAPSAVAGDAEVAVRWSQRLGVGFHAGVANRWLSRDRSNDSAASIEVRRIPLAVLVEVELRLRHGEIRLGAGPLLQLWRVESMGVSQPKTRYVAQPGLEVRAAYRHDLHRWFFEAGLQLDVGIVRQDFVVTGPGILSHTPLADIAPFLGVGMTL